MFIRLPMERLLFAEETGADVPSGGGGGSAVVDDDGLPDDDYDFGDEGEVDLFEDGGDDSAALAGDKDDEVADSEVADGDADDSVSGEDGEDSVADEAGIPGSDFDESLLNRAAQLGFNYNDVKSFGSNALLKLAVERSESLARSILEQQSSSTPVSPKLADPGSQLPNPAEQRHAAEEERIKALEEDGYGDDAVALMRSQNDEFLRQARLIDSLQSQSRQAQEQAAHAARMEEEVRFERTMDGYLEKLGDEYSPLFGKGASAEMSQGTQEFANRARLFQVAAGMKEMYAQRGWEIPSESRVFEMAVNAEFGDRSREIARNEVKSQLKRSSRATTARPSRSAGKALTGVERAVARSEEFFKSHGVTGDASGDWDEEI